MVITGRQKYLEGIKSLLPESSKIMQLPIDESKCINYFMNLANMLKDRFKVLKNEKKNSEKKCDSIYQVGTTPGIL